MKSQSFDDWLLADNPLDLDKETALTRAIASSIPGDNQGSMVQSFHEVETIFHSTPSTAPAPGFTIRWQARLARKKARQQRLLIGLIALLALGMAVIIGLALLTPQWVNFSLAQAFNSLISSLIRLTIRLNTLHTLGSYLLSRVPPAIPIAVWVGFATSMSLITLGWVYTMWRIIIPKGIKS